MILSSDDIFCSGGIVRLVNLGPELSCTSLANMTIKMEMSFTDSIVKLVDSPNNLAYAFFFFQISDDGDNVSPSEDGSFNG